MAERRGSRHSLSVFMFSLLISSVSVFDAWGHDGVVHKSPEESARHQIETQNTPGFPTVKGGNFNLIDQNGLARTSKNPNGQFQLLFFGYANCKAICSVALPRMAAAVDILNEKKLGVTPVLVTVDPKRDTLSTIGPAVKKIHPKMVGLTGRVEELEKAYSAFQVEKSLVFVDPDNGPVYSHGSFIYLLGPDGAFKTLLPPIVSADRIATVVEKYMAQ